MTSPKPISLALQGGGSHGAYTWGVLDRLLEEKTIAIEAISGTSAGAMNATILVNGYLNGGVDGAKEALYNFWNNVSEMNPFISTQYSWYHEYSKQWNLDWSPLYVFSDLMTRFLSPYQTNPFNLNPLRNVLASSIDFDRLRTLKDMKLYITATSVTTGQPHIFNHSNITPDALIASACLPSLFQAEQINNDYYWDGGYAGNPSIWPLTYDTNTSDIIIVEINPVVRKQLPQTSSEIINRLNEISFNASLIAEIKFINFVNEMIDENHVAAKKYRKINMHMIETAGEMLELNASSKVNTSWEFLKYLHHLGRTCADKWLKQNGTTLGIRSSVDVHEEYLRHTKHPFTGAKHQKIVTSSQKESKTTK